ncbi:hypothetical protein LZC95_40000 [Pendulispora brunnea]|uniref:DUF1585 domain-containing protein n=1 Tax=Pendulispora brunnea TaxID=2905690 RepID=A0ABZ2K5I4_9BACT
MSSFGPAYAMYLRGFSRFLAVYGRRGSMGFFLTVVLLACGGAGLSTSPAKPRTEAGREERARHEGGEEACPACATDATRYLRQLSLDLRGRPPSMEELEQVRTAGDVTPEVIDAMVRSDEFLGRVRTWHMALLWPNLDGFHLRGAPLVASDYDDATGRQKGGVFSPDPAMVEDGPAPKGKSGKRPAARGFVYHPDAYVNQHLRGGEPGSIVCDPRIEYPKPAAARMEGGRSVAPAQPTYTVLGTDKKKRKYPYYDADGVPLPYHDAAHCPNYCSSKSDAERASRDYKGKREYYAPMNAKGADAKPHELDPPDMHCPDAFPHRVVNSCDNHVEANDPEMVVRQRREGMRKMRHYWSGTTEVRTCAYDAQDRTNSATTGVSCAGNALRDPSCGCGPQGIYCMPNLPTTGIVSSRAEYAVRSALNEEPLRIVESVVAHDEDYFDIFRTRRSFMNGPLAMMYKNQLGTLQGLSLSAPASAEVLPDIPYDETGFREYLRDAQHAGVLTTPAYLGRFPTWRSRVSQFRTAFMCRPFTPGSAALPSPDDACTREPNLAQRCGCKNCHAALEPMTAWFGRWAERSAQYLSPAEYPAHDPSCEQCAVTKRGCTERCRTQYVVDTVNADGARYAGTLRGYLYRTKDEEARIDEGPEGLVASAIASGELESCTIRTAWGKLLGRGMSDDETQAVLPELAARFARSHHNYRDLIKAIVTSPAYRRVD